MAYNDPKNARVRASTTSSGTYTVVGFVTDAPLTRGSSGTTTTEYMGGRIVNAGDPTISGTVTCVYDDADTLGQLIIETAYENGTSVWLQHCPAGTATGAKVRQFEAKIDEISYDMNADNPLVMSSFNYTGVPGTLTKVTLA